MIRWRKLGLKIVPRPELWWWRSHCMIPTPLEIGPDLLRIYFSGRNDRNQSHIGWVEVDPGRIDHGDAVVGQAQEPVLAPGELGCFDDNGVTPSCAVRREDGLFLYYIGWNPGSTVRMHLYGGLAISGGRRSEAFARWSRAPIIERCPSDPFLNTAPFVVRADDGWYMYYVSGTGWRHRDLPRYNIRLARSADGKVWRRDGHVCVDFADDDENALARPFVRREADGLWRMWFAHKGEAYRLGYAESADGVTWERRDESVGIDAGPSGFDSEMIEYAAVVRHRGRHVMFYNGNSYGRDGIGVAVEE